MLRIDITQLERIGYGSFFITFRLSKTKVIKVPSMYDAWPTDEMKGILRRTEISAEDWLVFDALNGSRASGALPVYDLVQATGLVDDKLSLVMPYASEVNVEELRDFLVAYPHWDWDAHITNFGKWKGQVYRIDTQTRVTEELFVWA